MIGNVAHLIAELEQYGPEAPVFIAFQPNYPMAAEIAHITVGQGPMLLDGTDDDRAAVWIAATDVVGYAGGEVYDGAPDH